MSTTRKVGVRLTVAETEALIGICRDSARSLWEHSRRTKSASIRSYSQDRAVIAGDLASELTRRLYMTTENAAIDRGLANGTIEPPDEADRAESYYDRR